MTFGLCTIDTGPAVLSQHGVAPLVRLGVTTPTVRATLSDWDTLCDLLEDADRSGKLAKLSTPDTDVTFLPPLADPPAIYCAGANYHDHAREMGTDPPQATFHFLVSPASLTGHRSTVHRPEGCQRLDWEVELAIVIGRPASAIHPAAAADHIAGYTVANDLSARDHVRASGLGIDWLRHKSYAGFTPLGPAIVPRRLVPDATDLELTLTVNGQVKQHSNTNQMISGVGDQVAALSRIAPLRPGDVVLTGTPAGTAAAHGHYLHPGDVVVAEITGIGRLENRIA